MDKTTRELLLDLVNQGKSQCEISRGACVAQPTISRILNGINKEDYSRCHGKILDYYRRQMSNQVV